MSLRDVPSGFRLNDGQAGGVRSLRRQWFEIRTVVGAPAEYDGFSSPPEPGVRQFFHSRRQGRIGNGDEHNACTVEFIERARCMTGLQPARVLAAVVEAAERSA